VVELLKVEKVAKEFPYINGIYRAQTFSLHAKIISVSVIISCLQIVISPFFSLRQGTLWINKGALMGCFCPYDDILRKLQDKFSFVKIKMMIQKM